MGVTEKSGVGICRVRFNTGLTPPRLDCIHYLLAYGDMKAVANNSKPRCEQVWIWLISTKADGYHPMINNEIKDGSDSQIKQPVGFLLPGRTPHDRMDYKTSQVFLDNFSVSMVADWKVTEDMGNG